MDNIEKSLNDKYSKWPESVNVFNNCMFGKDLSFKSPSIYTDSLFSVLNWGAKKGQSLGEAFSGFSDKLAQSIENYDETENLLTTQKYNDNNRKNILILFTGLSKKHIKKNIKKSDIILPPTINVEGILPEFIVTRVCNLNFLGEGDDKKPYTFYYNLIEIIKQIMYTKCIEKHTTQDSHQAIFDPITQTPFDENVLNSFLKIYNQLLQDIIYYNDVHPHKDNINQKKINSIVGVSGHFATMVNLLGFMPATAPLITAIRLGENINKLTDILVALKEGLNPEANLLSLENMKTSIDTLIKKSDKLLGKSGSVLKISITLYRYNSIIYDRIFLNYSTGNGQSKWDPIINDIINTGQKLISDKVNNVMNDDNLHLSHFCSKKQFNDGMSVLSIQQKFKKKMLESRKTALTKGGGEYDYYNKYKKYKYKYKYNI